MGIGIVVAACISTAAAGATGTNPGIEAVTVSPSFFNPAIEEKASISFMAGFAGRVTVEILDRDRFVIRALPTREIGEGRVELRWD